MTGFIGQDLLIFLADKTTRSARSWEASEISDPVILSAPSYGFFFAITLTNAADLASR